ncbi:hypothetical protein [Coleofasciculus sp. FACHB-129]|nr:hypothetical protein [Coleofasciculus sp. FACHB-129]
MRSHSHEYKSAIALELHQKMRSHCHRNKRAIALLPIQKYDRDCTLYSK